jgi:hypothetical protein
LDDLELERHRRAIMDEAAPGWEQRADAGRTDAIGLRVLDVDGDLLVLAHVPAQDERRRFLIAINRHFPGAAVKFSP